MSRARAHSADVLIAGGGPAALALAHACVGEGLSALCVDPRPNTPWPNNYGLWLDELTSLGLDGFAARTWPEAEIYLDGERRHRLQRPYARLDNEALRRHLTAGVLLTPGTVERVEVDDAEARLLLGAGPPLTGRVVVDATGHRGQFTERVDDRAPGFQSAYGVVAEIEGELPDDVVGLMDFSPIPGAPEGAPLTFLYALPLAPGRAFLEETVLVGRPPADFNLLRDLLHLRLRGRGVEIRHVHETERCLIPMGAALPRPRQQVLPFGGAASMVHPATGYMMAHVLRSAPTVAHALAEALRRGASPAATAAAGGRALWPRQRRRMWQMYGFGMEVLLGLEPDGVRDFFDGFFQVPEARWQAYMAGEGSVGQLSATMLKVFGKVPAALKGRLMSQSFTGHGARMWGALLGKG